MREQLGQKIEIPAEHADAVRLAYHQMHLAESAAREAQMNAAYYSERFWLVIKEASGIKSARAYRYNVSTSELYDFGAQLHQDSEELPTRAQIEELERLERLRRGKE